MAFEKPSPVTALTQELRFATTMTGGVSLAIWMAGVTREINLLAQASQWRRLGGTFPTNSQLTNESAASLRLYAQLIDLLDMVVDVDILSGTSAGGINAALLASSRVTDSPTHSALSSRMSTAAVCSPSPKPTWRGQTRRRRWH